MTGSCHSFPRMALVAALAVSLLATVVRGEDWPQWRGPNRDGVWRETGIIERFASQELKPVWRTDVGPGYSGPTVAGGRVFVTDRITQPEQQERVLCLDAKTGAKQWAYVYPCLYRIDYPA